MGYLTDDLTWLTSSRTDHVGNHVEAAFLLHGGIMLRESEDPDGPALIYTTAEWAAFVAGVKNGEFDLPPA